MSNAFRKTGFVVSVTALVLGFALLSLPQAVTRAADHSEAPLADHDRPADIGDVYAFLDPADNTKVVFAFTVVGFIVPSENANQGAFDSNVRYRLELEETGDAVADRFIDVTFSERTSRTTPQTATIILPNGTRVTAPTTAPSLSATAPTRTVTTDAASGVSFFAGVADDPFFFDIPGFNRFVASIQSGAPDASQLARARDSFAGYNTMGVVVSVPLSMLRTTNGVIGVDMLTQRQIKRTYKPRSGEIVYSGKYANVDRMGVPAINTVLLPFARKDEYNRATTADDASGKFATDIIGTLTSLGTNSENVNILASVAVLNGDFLRLDTTIANTGPGGGNNAGAGFPNGRRFSDDVVDTVLFFVANQTTIGDNVNGNDVALTDTFPYLGVSQQPRNPDIADDNTRN